jgi:hypothetical protein
VPYFQNKKQVGHLYFITYTTMFCETNNIMWNIPHV